jgi:hypothetical protein
LDLPRGVDLRILERRAKLDTFQNNLAFAMQARRVDAFASGQVSGKFPQSLAELTGGANRIAALGVIQADREVDEGLQEKAARTTFRGPDFFPNFVALEEAAAIEEVNPALEQFVHDAT